MYTLLSYENVYKSVVKVNRYKCNSDKVLRGHGYQLCPLQYVGMGDRGVLVSDGEVLWDTVL